MGPPGWAALSLTITCAIGTDVANVQLTIDGRLVGGAALGHDT